MAKQIDVRIELHDGGTITPFNSLLIEQHTDGHHRFELRFPATVLEKRDNVHLDVARDYIGKQISIGLKEKEAGAPPENLFMGIIAELELSRNDHDLGEIIFRGYSPTILLDDAEHSSSFLELDLDAIVKRATAHVPQNLLKLQTSISGSIQIPYMAQYRETGFQFLRRLAWQYGQALYYNGSKLIFGKPSPSNKVKLSFSHDISDLKLAVKVTPLKFGGSSFDYMKKETNRSTAPSSGSTAGLDPYGKFAASESDKLYSFVPKSMVPQAAPLRKDLDKILKDEKDRKAGGLVMLHASSDVPALAPGTEVSVEVNLPENKDDFGNYVVISVSHYTDGLGNYNNFFEAVPSSLETWPATEPHMPVCEVQSAIVKKNDDPDGLGRIKVQFGWQESSDMVSPWLRIISPYTGNQKGMYFIPELGEEVLVAFEHGDPSRPYVLGSMYNGKDKPAWADKKNNKKAIKTRNGNILLFSDEDGKEEITIQNPKGTNEIVLSMQNDGEIRIRAKKTLSMQAEEIKMACKNFELKVEKDLKMETQNSLLKAMKSVMEASKEFSAKGAEMKLEGQTNTTIKSGAQMEINGGAKLDIKAGAMASVQAGIIKLN